MKQNVYAMRRRAAGHAAKYPHKSVLQTRPLKERELRSHLQSIFKDAGELDEAIFGIDACMGAFSGNSSNDRTRTERSAKLKALFKKVVAHVKRLRVELKNLPLFESRHERNEYLVALKRLEQHLAGPLKKLPGKGGAPRIKDKALGRLIRGVRDAYPAVGAKPNECGHFERTVQLVLSYLGEEEPEDLHGVIRRALK